MSVLVPLNFRLFCRYSLLKTLTAFSSTKISTLHGPSTPQPTNFKPYSLKGFIPKKPTSENVEQPSSPDSFSALGLSKTLCDALKLSNLTAPTEVQRLAIPSVQQNRDIIIHSETGSGKTIAYLAPILMKNPSSTSKAVIVVPTRELAVQTFSVLNKLSPQHHSHLVVSGVDDEEQLERVSSL